jgi:repressor LexA
MEIPLTPRQDSVLKYIRKHYEEHGIPPTVREICFQLGLKGHSGIHRVLNTLKVKGYLNAQSGKNRSWSLAAGPASKSIPVLGTIAAGKPIEAVTDSAEYLLFDPNIFGADNCFALTVQGESMIEAHILDGDLAIIRPQPSVSNGQIAAVTVEDLFLEATLKIVKISRNKIELHPENPVYEPLVFKADERKRVRIVGKFLGIIRRA